MLEFAHQLADKINQDESESANYFRSMIYIEDMFDKYARGMVRQSMQDTGIGQEEIETTMKKINESVESLRAKIRDAVQTYAFDDELKNIGEALYQNWHKR